MSHSSQAKTFGDWAVVAIARHYRKMLKHEEGVLRDDDPEELHQMRVGMRRLRTAIAGFTGAIILPKRIQAKRVGMIARSLGSLRDLDVQQEKLKQWGQTDLPAVEQKQLRMVQDTLHKQRQKTFKEIRLILKGDSYKTLKQGLEDWLQRPQLTAIAALPIQDVLPDLLLPTLSQFFIHPAWLVNTKVKENGERVLIEDLTFSQVDLILENQESILHDLRKQAKQTRYQLELFTDFYDCDYQEMIKSIKAIQEILGDINDSMVLRAWLDKICEGKALLWLPVLIEKIQGDRLQKWQAWQPLQQTFLNPQQRMRSRLIIQQSLLSTSESPNSVN
ncbi:MAG: CHAD domain-containing protein [Snowella sp.]|nr:CHAD domain-containing protein [Snowella sp.]